MNSLLIYAHARTNRVTYTFDLLLKDLLGLQYELTEDANVFTAHAGPKFSYAKEPVGNELFFRSFHLLFEEGVRHQPMSFVEKGKLKGFFSVLEPSALPFDIFASTFFVVSRYKEYLPSKIDKYGRFRSSQSMLYKAGLLEKPLVNLYALHLKKMFQDHFPGLVYKQHKFSYIPTFDIDQAYSYLHKGFKRTAGAIVRSFIHTNFKDLRERFEVLTGRKPDPFDTYDYIFDVCRANKQRPMFFFLLGDGSRFDKNISVEETAFRQLMEQVAQKAEVGIHLSFKSHVSSRMTQREIKRLEKVTGQEITRNRYHYLRFQLPTSYSMLLKNGIKEDYSMGYAPRAGFRAGICTPFYWYNLKTDTVTDLKLFPIAFMDTTFTEYRKTTPKESLEKIKSIIKAVKEVEGTVYGLWHNSSFTEQGVWHGWRKVFEETAAYAQSLEVTEPVGESAVAANKGV
ncbi:MAG: polysaccharide deacetylase family protein [Chitinophagales bacterium]